MSSSPLATNIARAKPELAKFDQACGGKKAYKNDAERVAFLFELHQKLTAPADDATHTIK